MDVLPASLNNASQQAYVSELLSFSLDRLHKEPELLRVDSEKIRRQMQDLAVGHYRAFIVAAEALHSIGEEMTSIDKHLETLISEIPQLTGGCNKFMEHGQQILEKRIQNQMLLANHSAILDLLEIPQLMDTCVRNGNYDEALDLEAFVSKLATMHSKLPVIQTLVTDVKQITHSMLSQLLQRLRSSIQLPECLRVIGYLRRLGVFTEHEMRLQFLRCRDTWLAGILDDLDQGNHYDYLKRLADCHRVHLFDVVTQYRAIFTDDTSGNEEKYDGGLLYSWAMHRITLHLAVLHALLPKISDGMSLATLLEQCMYCGMSLGRVGMDFRGLLPPLFETSVYNLFSSNMAATIENFQHVLDSHRWISLPTVGTGNRGLVDGNLSDNADPPYVLMEHPPLAAFVNGVLAALNELRHCAPLNLKDALASELQKALQAVSDSLLRYNATCMLRENESNLFMSMCRAFIEVACPYCISSFKRCYPASNLIDSKDLLENLRKLVFTASFPVLHNNGFSSPVHAINDRRENPPNANSHAAESLANGEVQLTSNGSEASVEGAAPQDYSADLQQSEVDDGIPAQQSQTSEPL
ncbi:hypothetical protein GOP47_0002087 [Adiantum capillus-veneris]|uniref:Conserved oligomeric Golgi complex subunit 8 n=1 Tax=Adiantum capillus-veneris TaxID=13818 RepID=A0A9D4ZNV5_ADICA|nr:hypothetical protein GOP47_0002087 [Adiantum capillus-veneris]